MNRIIPPTAQLQKRTVPKISGAVQSSFFLLILIFLLAEKIYKDVCKNADALKNCAWYKKKLEILLAGIYGELALAVVFSAPYSPVVMADNAFAYIRLNQLD